jgi:hypothetical protein
VHDLFAVRLEELTTQGQETGREAVMNTLTGRAAGLVRGFRKGIEPLPATACKHSATNLAQGRFVQFTVISVGIGVGLFQ